MDERQQQIKEGAGLDESRVNQELIDFLNKWSTPVLVVLLALVGLYWGWGKYQQYKLGQVNEAFASYEAATAGGNPSPDSLLQVAETYDGIRAVPSLAKLTTADLYLRAATIGLEPGTTPDPATGKYAEGDILDEQSVRSYLESAERLYGEVAQSATAAERWLLAANANMGLAAANASLGRTAEADAALAAARSAAEQGGYADMLAAIDSWRPEILPEGSAELYANADLPQPPEPEQIPEGDTPGESVTPANPVDPGEPVIEEVVPLPGTEVVPEGSVVPSDPADIPDETPAESDAPAMP